MLLITTDTNSGFNDFFPMLSSIFVREGRMKISDWQRYRRWMPIFFICNVGTLSAAFVSFIMKLTIVGEWALELGAAYFCYVMLRRSSFKVVDFILDERATVTTAPLIAWLEEFTFNLTQFLCMILGFTYLSGIARLLAGIVGLIAFGLILLPFLNLLSFRRKRTETYPPLTR